MAGDPFPTGPEFAIFKPKARNRQIDNLPSSILKGLATGQTKRTAGDRLVLTPASSLTMIRNFIHKFLIFDLDSERVMNYLSLGFLIAKAELLANPKTF